MTCREIQDELSAWLDHELSAEDKAAVRAHLETCAACRGELESLRVAAAMVRRLPRAKAPADLADRVLAATAAEREPPAARRAWRIPRYILWPAMAAAVALLVTLYHREQPAPMQSRATDRVEAPRLEQAAPREFARAKGAEKPELDFRAAPPSADETQTFAAAPAPAAAAKAGGGAGRVMAKAEGKADALSATAAAPVRTVVLTVAQIDKTADEVVQVGRRYGARVVPPRPVELDAAKPIHAKGAGGGGAAPAGERVVAMLVPADKVDAFVKDVRACGSGAERMRKGSAMRVAAPPAPGMQRDGAAMGKAAVPARAEDQAQALERTAPPAPAPLAGGLASRKMRTEEAHTQQNAAALKDREAAREQRAAAMVEVLVVLRPEPPVPAATLVPAPAATEK